MSDAQVQRDESKDSQTKIDLLRDLNSKLTVEIDELRRIYQNIARPFDFFVLFNSCHIITHQLIDINY